MAVASRNVADQTPPVRPHHGPNQERSQALPFAASQRSGISQGDHPGKAAAVLAQTLSLNPTWFVQVRLFLGIEPR